MTRKRLTAVVALGLTLVLGPFGAGCTPGGRSGGASGEATAAPPTAAPPTQIFVPPTSPPAPTAIARVEPTATPPSAAQQPAPRLSPEATVAPRPGEVATGPAKPESYRAIERAMTRIRGLQVNREVELRFMTQAELRKHLQEGFDRDYTPEERARDQKLLVTLGLIRPDQDLTAIMLDLLSEQVLGFYDDEDKRMNVIAEASEPTPSLKVTFAHEFTHALQDEHFRLKDLNPPHGDNDDRSAAVQALVEGDATLAMSLYAQGELSTEERRRYLQSERSDGSGSFERAPLVLREELIFPYEAGLRFVQRLHRQGGYGAVDAAFRNPPQSTEQIIHPEKYAASEAPVAVTLPDLASALGSDWQQTTANTLGELDLKILVEQFTDRQTGERAATGWGGDRYALLEDSSGRATVVVKTTWDSERDALEFFEGYAQAMQKRLGTQARPVVRDGSREVLVGGGYASLVVQRGRDVAIVVAPDEAVMERLGAALSGP